MGRILHSNVACASILGHISVEMRKTTVNEIIKSNNKSGLIIGESITSVSYTHLDVYKRQDIWSN